MRQNEEGATAILVAVSLLMIFGLVALGIDGSLAFNDRRGSQNAADIAAMAAAWESCNPADSATTPVNAALAAAAENGYDNTDAGVQVNVTGPSAASDGWTVAIQKVSGGVFGPATPYAPDNIDVISTATAHCVDQPILGGYALFAGAATCPGINELNTTSSSVTVNGNVHTNGDVNTGASFDVTGNVTYRGDNKISDPDTEATKFVGSAIKYPLDLTLSDYDLGSPRADAANAFGEYYDFGSSVIDEKALTGWSPPLAVLTATGIKITHSGIYRTDGDVTLGKVELAPDVRVTFVAKGQIKLTGNSDFEGYDPIEGPNGPRMALFSEYQPTGNRCNNKAITVSSNGVAWDGVIFAPNGSVDISASSATGINGSIISFVINLSGSSITVSFQDDPDRPPNLSMELIR